MSARPDGPPVQATGPGTREVVARRAPGRRGRVLLAADDPAVSGRFAAALRRAGFCVRVAVDGGRALTELRTEGCDLLVTDIVLPEGDGLELLGWVRRWHAGMPAIALTGDGPDDGALYARAARCLGAAATVARSADPAGLLAAAHRLVGQTHGREPAPPRSPAA